MFRDHFKCLWVRSNVLSIFTHDHAKCWTQFHIFTVIYSITGGFISNQRNDQFPVGFLAQLLQHYTDIAEVMCSNPAQAWIFSSCCCFASSVCKSSVHSRLGLQHRETYGWRPNLRSQLRHFTCSLLYFPYSILSPDCNIAIYSFDYALFLRSDVPHVASKWDRPDWERIEEPESAPK